MVHYRRWTMKPKPHLDRRRPGCARIATTEVARAALRRLERNRCCGRRATERCTQQLQRADLAGETAPSRSEESERIVERMLQGVIQRLRGQQDRRPLFKAAQSSHQRDLVAWP
mgnify:CR=1 FL=1